MLNNARPCTSTIISVLKASYLSGRISAGCGTGGQACVEGGGGESGGRHMYYSSERELYIIQYCARATKAGGTSQWELFGGWIRKARRRGDGGEKEVTGCHRKAAQVTKPIWKGFGSDVIRQEGV